MLVTFSNNARRQIFQLSEGLRVRLEGWIREVTLKGIVAVRQNLRWEDKPKKGNLAGFRTIKLNKGYRVLYEEKKDEKGKTIIEIKILEVGNDIYPH